METLLARLPWIGAALVLAAAAPVALRSVEPGLWEVSRSATGEGAERVCLTSMLTLAQFEHRGERCSPAIVADRPTEVVVHSTCQGGDFSRTRVTVLTPRSLRIDTQGIHRGAPFSYQLHARRAGSC